MNLDYVPSTDPWEELWDIATAEADGPARIEVDAEDSHCVVLVWPDGSRGGWFWREGLGWQPSESMNTVPGDVAARDTL